MPEVITIDTREGHLGIDISDSSVCSGVNIDSTHPKDLCYAKGLRASMVIVKVDGTSVDSHASAMELMQAAKAEGKKLTIEYLSPSEAEARGAAEWQTQKKWIIRGLLFVVVLICGLVAAFSSGMLKLPEMPKAQDGTSPAPGMSMENEMKGMQDAMKNMPKMPGMENMPDMETIKKNMEKFMPNGVPDMEAIKKMHPNLNMPGKAEE